MVDEMTRVVEWPGVAPSSRAVSSSQGGGAEESSAGRGGGKASAGRLDGDDWHACKRGTIKGMAYIVLDVRSAAEYAGGHLRGAVNLDIHDPDFRDKLWLLNRDDGYIVYCNGGTRAAQACAIMEGLGFTDTASYSLELAQFSTARPVVTQD